MFASQPCVRHASRAWALNDLACMGTTHNASGNKGVLHTLEADCPEAQVDNLYAKRPTASSKHRGSRLTALV